LWTLGQLVRKNTSIHRNNPITIPYSIKLLSTTNGEVVGNIIKHQGTVSGLTLGEDFNTLATGSEDTTVIIWNFSKVMKDLSQGKVSVVEYFSSLDVLKPITFS